ncbi:ATP-binding cassette domain-containing protein [Paenibacillus sp. ACRRX]|uniref:ABC transporter ATP-binding protein n=1 Tax=Paenibacillus sp. ACRRX TaxID=2918206 RepID=UPI001EF6EC0E|nr:ATP-binding cassette domain-containing protein [Paenibacillus sp. ACRRX]MCG7408923.1 ATP-binding cassette domain-containing protein [Paenibacillus sp. ACRRX]
MPVIQVDNLFKKYDKAPFPAVRNLSFQVEQGEIFGLLGPNGAGKSTTFKMLTTLLEPTEGSIFILNRDTMTSQKAIREHIGYVSQIGGHDHQLTAYENLRWISKLYHIPRKQMNDRIMEVLDYVHLLEVKDNLLMTFSGGMRRRFEIATALLHHPKILFLDEPSAGLDVEHRYQLWHVLERLKREQNMTVFLTTHYLEEADRLCDRVMIIQEGQCVCLGEPEQLKQEVGGDQVYITVAEHSSDITEEQLRSQLLEEHEQLVVKRIQINEACTELRFWVDQGHRQVTPILDLLSHYDVQITSVRVTQPTLDDVMMQYTQRSIQYA